MFILCLTLCMLSSVACFCCSLLTFYFKMCFFKIFFEKRADLSLLSVEHKRSTFSNQVYKILPFCSSLFDRLFFLKARKL